MFEDWEFHARVARRTVLAFVDYPTTVNRGHRSAERLTLASRLHKAESYLGLVERVWMADPEFMATHAADVRQAEGRALLAIAREAILVSRIDAARAALRRWRSLDLRERRSRALCYGACAVVPGGRALLRTALRGRTVARLLLGRGHRAYSVNPAA